MSDGEPYENPEKLAEARYRGGEVRSYGEMAEYLGCSQGTISIKMKKYEDEISEYSKSDFAGRLTPADTPAEFDLSEVRSIVTDLFSEVAEVEATDDGILVDEYDIFIFIAGKDSIIETFRKANDRAYFNSAIAVSEHQIDHPFWEDIENSEVGVLVATDDGIRIEQDCSFHDGSGFWALIDEDAPTHAKYTSKAWLKKRVGDGVEPIDMAREASVRTPTIESKINQFNLA